MELTLYRTLDGLIVVMPDCFLPALGCRSHEPLTRCGSVTVADARCVDSWQSVMRDIEFKSFAILDQRAARRLLGDEYLGDSFPPACADSTEQDLFGGSD